MRIQQHIIFSLYEHWEALAVGKTLPQGPLRIPTPGKPQYDSLFFISSFKLIQYDVYSYFPILYDLLYKVRCKLCVYL